MTDEAKPNVRVSGPVEGPRGNREVPPPAGEPQESLEERLAEAEARAEEYLALAQRTQADFENYRKRAARDQESLVARAHERVVKELLPILDDLERALDAATQHEEAKLEEAAKPPVRAGGPEEGARGNREVPPSEHERFEHLTAGVALVHKAFADLLAREGLVEIATDGAFDPHVHEALLAQPAEDAESGHVLQVLQKGYRLGDKVVRPARVIVAE